MLVPSSPNDGWGIACKPITDFFCRHDGSRSEDLEWNLLGGRLDQLTQRFPRETGKRVGARRSVLIKPWSFESPAQMSTEGPGNCLGHQEIPHAQKHLLSTYSTEVAVKKNILSWHSCPFCYFTAYTKELVAGNKILA